MCDPLSIVASVLTVAGVAANSCECLHKTLTRYSKAPRDLQHHIYAIEGLQSTFAGIAALEKTASVAAIMKPEFKGRLQACILDLQTMERLAKSLYAQLEAGRARRVLARIQWSSVGHQQTLKSHLNRIETYHTTFSLELLLLNM